MKTVRRDLAIQTHLSKYARYLPEKRRRETIVESNQRVMDMHRRKYPHLPESLMADIQKALDDDLILGSMRSQQFGGIAIERENARLYNCSASYFDRVRFLQEAVWLLLCGCGVGFSVQKHHVAKLPRLVAPHNNTYLYVVEDSIAGWADAFGELFESYLGDPGDCTVRFDYSKVRPEGSPISTSSAKAPGAKPLRDSLEACRKLFDRIVADGGVIRPIDAYDLVMHAAMCVRAGGIRRSATIALFSADDAEMAQAKTGNWFKENPQRRLSNNSALLVRSEVTREQFDALIESTQQFGEPGFYFADSTEEVPNPCVEIGMFPFDEITQESGFSFCNVTSINAAKCPDMETFLRAADLAAALGTLQAGYQTFGYLTQASSNINKRDALLGVSLTGLADSPWVMDEHHLRRGVDVVRQTNVRIAQLIGVAGAARLTCVKPEGTGSLRVQAGNGIHPHHSRRYVRLVEGGKPTDAVSAFVAKHVPGAVIQSVYNPAEVKIAFPIDLGQGDLWLKTDTKALEHLELVRLVQDAWVAPGTTRGTIRHNVSNTIQVGPEEWGDVADLIWKHRDTYAGVSLMGSSGDLDYPQAPFTEVLTEEEIQSKYSHDPEYVRKAREIAKLYDEVLAKWPSGGIPWEEMTEDEDTTAGIEVIACAGGACLT